MKNILFTTSVWLATAWLSSSVASAQCLQRLEGARRVGNRSLVTLSSTLRVVGRCTLSVGNGGGTVGVTPGSYDYLGLARVAGVTSMLPSLLQLRDATGRVEEISPQACVEGLRREVVTISGAPGGRGGSVIRANAAVLRCGRVEVFSASASEGDEIGPLPEGATVLPAAGLQVTPVVARDVWIRRVGGQLAWRARQIRGEDPRTEAQRAIAGASPWPFLTLQSDRLGRLAVVLPPALSALIAEVEGASMAGALHFRVAADGRIDIDPTEYEQGTLPFPRRVVEEIQTERYGAAGAGLHPTPEDVMAMAARLEICLPESYATWSAPGAQPRTAVAGQNIVCARVASAALNNLRATAQPLTVTGPSAGRAEASLPLLTAGDFVVAQPGHVLRLVRANRITRCVPLPTTPTPLARLLGADTDHAWLAEELVGSCEGADDSRRLAAARFVVLGRNALRVRGPGGDVAGGEVSPEVLRYQISLPPAAWAALARVPRGGLAADLVANPISPVTSPGASRFAVVLSREAACGGPRVSPSALGPTETYRAHLVARGVEGDRCLTSHTFRVPGSLPRRWPLGASGVAFEALPARLLIGPGVSFTGGPVMVTALYPVVTFEYRLHGGAVDLGFALSASLWAAEMSDANVRSHQLGATGTLEVNLGAAEGRGAWDRVVSIDLNVGSPVLETDAVGIWAGAHVNLIALFDGVRELARRNGTQEEAQ